MWRGRRPPLSERGAPSTASAARQPERLLRPPPLLARRRLAGEAGAARRAYCPEEEKKEASAGRHAGLRSAAGRGLERPVPSQIRGGSRPRRGPAPCGRHSPAAASPPRQRAPSAALGRARQRPLPCQRARGGCGSACVCGAAAAGLRGLKMEGCGAERRAGASPLSSLFFLILFSSIQGPSGRSWPASVGSGLLGLIAVRRAVAPGCRYRGRPSDRDMCCCVRQGWGTAWGLRGLPGAPCHGFPAGRGSSERRECLAADRQLLRRAGE